MAFKYFDRVKEISATTGTGAISLGGAVASYRSFSSVYSNADTLYYCITDQAGNNWEVGVGTYTSGGNSLSRSVIASSNANALVNFVSGALFVFVTIAARQLTNTTGTTVGSGSVVLNTNTTLTDTVTFVNVGAIVPPQAGIYTNFGDDVEISSGGVSATNISSDPAATNFLKIRNEIGETALTPNTNSGSGDIAIRVRGLNSGSAVIESGQQNASLFLDDAGTASLSLTGSGSPFTLGGKLVFDFKSNGIVFKRGANGKVGTVTLNGTTPVVVGNTTVTLTDTIVFSLNTIGGTVGACPTIKTITAATGFTVAGTAADTSVYNYTIFSNAA